MSTHDRTPDCFGTGHPSALHCHGCNLKAACVVTQYHNTQKAVTRPGPPDKVTSDGSTASYYELPDNKGQLQELISYRNMNGQDAEMFRALYRKGHCSHSSKLREAKKVLFYAQAEVARLEKYGEGA